MPPLILPQVPSGLSIEELSDIVAKLMKEIEWIGNGFLDSKNIRNIAGFNVGNTELKHISGIVGMSGANPGAATAVRFWAGHAVPTSAPFQVLQDGTIKSTKGKIGGFVIGANELTDTAGSMGFDSTVTGGNDLRMWAGSTTPSTAPFRVYEDGSVYGSNFTLEGGVIRTAATNNQRIELSSGSFKGYTSDNLLSGLVFDPIKASDIVDLFLYHRGAKLAEFFDNITSFRIRGTSGSTGFGLGGIGATTFAFGIWDFSTTLSIEGIPISAVTNLESRLSYLENNAFINAFRTGNYVVFDSKNVLSVDSADVSG